MSELQLLVVLFGTNLVSKKIKYSISTFLVQIRRRFNAHFSWEAETLSEFLSVGQKYFVYIIKRIVQENPTKHLCILMPPPFWHKISAVQ